MISFCEFYTDARGWQSTDVVNVTDEIRKATVLGVRYGVDPWEEVAEAIHDAERYGAAVVREHAGLFWFAAF